jgi:ribosomal protein S18 acetylase RimI-like enzyme
MTIRGSRTLTRVAGLLLRPVTWPEEAQLVADVNNASRFAGGSLFVMNVEVIRAWYDHLVNCDLARDLQLAEADGRSVGYVRVKWRDENRGDRVHGADVFVTADAPAGAFGALLDWVQARHVEIARTHGAVERPRTASISTQFEPPDARSALVSRGFVPVRYGFEMRRPNLEGIPDLPLPAGVEVRPVQPEQMRRIWEAEVEAFSGHWGAGEDSGSDAHWQMFLADPFNRDNDLWQVAWDGDGVVGVVRPFINDDDNARSGVRRGWCENISTSPRWRGRGVASALISRALRALRERGITEAALGVDAQNETGALHLYEKMGFSQAARETEWRRPFFLDDSPATGARP